MNTNVLVHSTGHNTLRYSVHSFYIPDQYFGILLYQCLYFNYIILCMILPRNRLGLAAMKEIPLYWSGLMKEWKCEEKPEVYHGEWSPSGSPSAKTLGACGPKGSGLGTSRGTPFTMIPPRLYHTLSHCTVYYTVHYSVHCTAHCTVNYTVCIVL